MELILKYFLSENLLFLKFGVKGIWNNILWKNKIQNFGKDLDMQYAMNAWWKFYIWKTWDVTSVLKDNLIFVDEEGVPRGIPKLWSLYLLDIFWGDMGIPKLDLLSILYLISSFSFPYTWKLPPYKTSHNSISNISVSMIVNLLFWFSFQLKYNTH
jgi:hypothetical protein